MLIWPEASRAQNDISGGVGRRQHGLRLDPPLELLVEAFDGVRGPGASPLRWWQAGEGEEGVAGLLQAIGDGPVAEPPLADKGPAPLLDLLCRGGVDHVGVVGGDLLVQALGAWLSRLRCL